jgi:hypothetical protein
MTPRESQDIDKILSDYRTVLAALGKKGRAVNSPAQQQAARQNGRRGGRPRKTPR